MEKSISILLDPSIQLLSKYQSLDGINLSSLLIEKFSQALLDCIYSKNKIKIKFTESGAKQFNIDIEVFWDWIVNNNLTSTNLEQVKKLKTICLIVSNANNTPSMMTKRRNRINPTASFIQSNEEANNATDLNEYELRREYRQNCFSHFLCTFFQ